MKKIELEFSDVEGLQQAITDQKVKHNDVLLLTLKVGKKVYYEVFVATIRTYPEPEKDDRIYFVDSRGRYLNYRSLQKYSQYAILAKSTK